MNATLAPWYLMRNTKRQFQPPKSHTRRNRHIDARATSICGSAQALPHHLCTGTPGCMFNRYCGPGIVPANIPLCPLSWPPLPSSLSVVTALPFLKLVGLPVLLPPIFSISTRSSSSRYPSLALRCCRCRALPRFLMM
jgi:hypothetical protein